jgi:hypothetical protein
MIMSEYEERFRSPTPSLHQIFAEARGPNRGQSRSRRLWAAVALVGVMTLTSKAALHHTTIVTARKYGNPPSKRVILSNGIAAVTNSGYISHRRAGPSDHLYGSRRWSAAPGSRTGGGPPMVD